MGLPLAGAGMSEVADGQTVVRIGPLMFERTGHGIGVSKMYGEDGEVIGYAEIVSDEQWEEFVKASKKIGDGPQFDFTYEAREGAEGTGILPGHRYAFDEYGTVYDANGAAIGSMVPVDE